MALELQLEQALERDQFHLMYQPEVDRHGDLVGAEALLRWTLSDGTPVAPDLFIPLAEQTGQMHRIGEWVIDAACRQLAQWRDMGLNMPRLAVNISAVQFDKGQHNLQQLLLGAVNRHGLDPCQLELEVTETALLANPRPAGLLLDQLAQAGFRVAIDDFGTGYSSLVNLHTLPVHKLKIDKSFVDRITESATDRAIIESTLVIAQKLGLETLAEGVETEAQWEGLKGMGCSTFQGYLFGRPMPPKALAAMLPRS